MGAVSDSADSQIDTKQDFIIMRLRLNRYLPKLLKLFSLILHHY